MATATAQRYESLIDLERDDLRPVAEIAQERTGKRPPPGTVWRWRLRGCHGAKLEAVFVHGRWCTTAEAFADFIRRQTAAAINAREASDVDSGERDEATDRRLKKAGLI